MNYKKILSLLFLLLSITLAQAEPAFLQTFKPVERVHDFGTIYEKDGKVSTVFSFKNTGDKVAAISDVNTWCGCMAVDYTKKAIRPGETATMKVSIDPDHKHGVFIKQVVLLLNDGKNYVRIWVKAKIIPMQHPIKESCPYELGQGLFTDLTCVPFPHYGKGQQYSKTLQLGNNTKKAMTVTFLRQPNNTVLKMPNTITLKAGEVKQVKLLYYFSHSFEKTSCILLYPTVNGRKTKPIKVRWNGNEKFKLNL